jgi:hypothetical protein
MASSTMTVSFTASVRGTPVLARRAQQPNNGKAYPVVAPASAQYSPNSSRGAPSSSASSSSSSASSSSSTNASPEEAPRVEDLAKRAQEAFELLQDIVEIALKTGPSGISRSLFAAQACTELATKILRDPNNPPKPEAVGLHTNIRTY